MTGCVLFLLKIWCTREDAYSRCCKAVRFPAQGSQEQRAVESARCDRAAGDCLFLLARAGRAECGPDRDFAARPALKLRSAPRTVALHYLAILVTFGALFLAARSRRPSRAEQAELRKSAWPTSSLAARSASLPWPCWNWSGDVSVMERSACRSRSGSGRGNKKPRHDVGAQLATGREKISSGLQPAVHPTVRSGS